MEASRQANQRRRGRPAAAAALAALIALLGSALAPAAATNSAPQPGQPTSTALAMDSRLQHYLDGTSPTLLIKRVPAPPRADRTRPAPPKTKAAPSPRKTKAHHAPTSVKVTTNHATKPSKASGSSTSGHQGSGRKRTPSYWDWDRLAQCESGRRWNLRTGNGYEGGLQYSPRTWRADKPAGYPSRAYQASREQQIAVGEITYSRQGASAWPACTRRFGWR